MTFSAKDLYEMRDSIEWYIMDVIRHDTDIDNILWLENMMKCYHAFEICNGDLDRDVDIEVEDDLWTSYLDYLSSLLFMTARDYAVETDYEEKEYLKKDFEKFEDLKIKICRKVGE